jgi:ubiquinone/menaquinone biosynthesis C-methylase UbiE
VFDYDAELQRYRPLFRDACQVGPGDAVLDIGCGAGQSTLDAARAAVGGTVLGMDLSGPALAAARARNRREGLHNVTFAEADAQRHPFPANHFDLAISRFGTMFFADPVEAFTNIGRAVRPAGRLVMLVWQAIEHQEWVTTIHRGLGADVTRPVAADPFSLADPDTVRGILDAAGFTAVRLADLREPLYYGPDATSARDAVLGLRMATELLAGHADADRPRALERLRSALAAHETDRGVWFDSRAWLVTADAGGRGVRPR